MRLYKNLKSRFRIYYINKIVGNNLQDPKVKNSKVIVYISGGFDNYYQLEQWINPLKELNKKHSVLNVVRSTKLYTKIKEENIFSTVWLRTLNDLITFYNENKFPVILYVNNANQNFQSLSFNYGYHIHLNHGESEKESMYSNQSKAYDYVFCVGQRAIERYKENLLNFNSKKYVAVGRPQLDYIENTSFKNKKQQKVILYAPTWEGHHQDMDYSSVAQYGVSLIEHLLKDPNYYVIYKPHGNIGLRSKDSKLAHNQIIKLIEKNVNAELIENMDINTVFTAVDFAFFDNSSVMIDYLHTNKPASFFEIKSDEGMRFLSKCFDPIDDNNFINITEYLQEQLRTDPNKEKRKAIKELYLDKYTHMESTHKFISSISEIIELRN